MQEDTSTAQRLHELETAVRSDPGDRDSLIELGKLRQLTRDFDGAARAFRAALEGGSDAGLWNELGRALNNLRDLAGAEDAFERAVGLDGGFAQAHNNLGHVRRARGALDAAERSFRAAIAADPQLARAHHNLATVLFQTGRPDEAVDAFRTGLRLGPEDPEALTNLADLLRFAERYREAEANYLEAIEIDRSYVDAWASLGSMYLHRRQLDAAEEALTEALRLMPGHSIALSGMAALKELQGDYAAGERLLEPLIRAGRATPELTVAYGRLLYRLGRSDEALAAIEPVAKSVPDPRLLPPVVHYTLGDLYDATGAYDAAFSAYRTANASQPSQFDPDEHARRIDAILRFFDADTLAGLARASLRRQVPVFIVGMPRSGTSLVEQILGSHSQVHAGGERGEMLALSHSIQAHLGGRRRYPRCLTGATRRDLDGLAERYFDSFGELGGDATHVTDKMPANFMVLGLIALLCPNARVVHCRRQPLDVGLSCYFQNFNSAGLTFTRSFEHIGVYYRQYQLLMERWHEVLDLPILDLDYEALVGDVETGARRLVEFAGLDWEPACLEFHRLDRTLNTASHAQVRQPVYTTSVGRHRHYDRHLGPLRQALGLEGD